MVKRPCHHQQFLMTGNLNKLNGIVTGVIGLRYKASPCYVLFIYTHVWIEENRDE